MQPSDERLIDGFLQGEQEAVQVIEGWIVQAARPFQRRLDTQWPDVLQEIRLEVVRLLRRGAFRGEARLKTYLWRVINHTCVNQLRARTKWQWVDLDALDQRWEPAEDSPLKQLLERESEHLRLRVLEMMPAECRQLWAMILDGLSYEQISQRLGISDVALRQRVLRCRKKAVALLGRWVEKKR